MIHDSIRRVREKYLVELRRRIEDAGYAIHMFAGDAITPPWAYTVGLAKAGRPEWIVLGARSTLATRILGELAKHAEADGVPDGGATRITLPAGAGHLKHLDLRVRTVAVPETVWHHMVVWKEIIGGGPPMIRQAMWPWTNGAYPGEEGYPDVGARDGCQDLTAIVQLTG